jgi:hypothetical protein
MKGENRRTASKNGESVASDGARLAVSNAGIVRPDAASIELEKEQERRGEKEIGGESPALE